MAKHEDSIQEMVNRVAGADYVPVAEMDFTLNRLRTKGKNVTQCNWDETRRVNGVAYVVNHKNDKTANKNKPESMQLALNDLKPMVLDVMYFGEVQVAGNGNPDVEVVYEKVNARTTVTGIKYSGTVPRRSVQIEYDLLAENGLVMGGFKTHAIQIDADTYGWEAELSDKLDRINKEAYSYMCTNKDAQMDMLEELTKEPEKTSLEIAMDEN